MQLELRPVYSKLADSELLAQYPDLATSVPTGMQLSQHQVETYGALVDPDIDVVINSAMTGDGKSLAGQLPLLVRGEHMMALYPTNELIADQFANVLRTLPRWKRNPASVATVSGPQLDDLALEAEFGQRGDHLATMLKNHQLVLTNPDILHAILQFAYRQGRAPDWMAGQLIQLFQQLTFDEFHIFAVAIDTCN